MIKSLWITGILIALSTFGIKVGLGAASLVYDRALRLGRKLIFLIVILFIYFLLFLGLYTLVRHFQLLKYLDNFLKVMRYGIFIHLFVALGLIVWGIKLLLSVGRDCSNNSPKGVFLLIFPCPVCATVIFLTLSLAYSVFSISLQSTTILLFGIFSTIAIFTIFLLFPFRRQIGTKNSSFLGLVMIMVAVYFLLTLIIAPVYQETQDIYYLASQGSTAGKVLDLKSLLILLAIGITLFGMGFANAYKKLDLERSK